MIEREMQLDCHLLNEIFAYLHYSRKGVESSRVKSKQKCSHRLSSSHLNEKESENVDSSFPFALV